uniref:Lipocalin/cytosolic fatty-acid binding domain-containing protein n=1 Tax=Arion vulgaris TaxID=1028688 RepID=A0A0B6XZK0_9EUPU
MEAFCGKWTPDVNSVKGAVEYLTTVAAPESQIEEIRNTTLVEIALDDDIFSVTNYIEGKGSRTDVMKLGEDTSSESPDGVIILSNTRFENNCLITVLSIYDVDIKVVRRIQDGVMVCEFTSSGKTLTFNLIRT